MISVKLGPAHVLLAVLMTGCSYGGGDTEKFAQTGKRMAHLPDSCSDVKVTHYERVGNKNFKDGEFFKVQLNDRCGKLWMAALGESKDFACDEDHRDMTFVAEKPMYSCFSGAEILTSGATVTFHGNGEAQLLWVVPV